MDVSVMSKTKYPVKFFKGTLEQYNSITPDDYTFYFLTDVDKIYLGDVQLSNSQIYSRLAAINQALTGKASVLMNTKENWNSNVSLIGQANTFYIYTNRDVKRDENGDIVEDNDGNPIYLPGIKVGDGLTYLIDLPFVDDLFYDHIHNTNIHVTLAQKQFWNNKVRTQDSEIDEENLIFTIH